MSGGGGAENQEGSREVRITERGEGQRRWWGRRAPGHRMWDEEDAQWQNSGVSSGPARMEQGGSDHGRSMKSTQMMIKNLLYREQPLKGFRKGENSTGFVRKTPRKSQVEGEAEPLHQSKQKNRDRDRLSQGETEVARSGRQNYHDPAARGKRRTSMTTQGHQS